MEPRLSLVTLATSDLARALRFYRDGLGWKVAFHNDDVAFFPLNGVVLGLWRRDAFAAEVGADRSAFASSGFALAHNVRERAEADQVLAEAEAAGGRVIVPAHDTDWGGRSGYFTDPDGHRWEVAWNPAWRIDDDGDVHMTPA